MRNIMKINEKFRNADLNYKSAFARLTGISPIFPPSPNPAARRPTETNGPDDRLTQKVPEP
jgi:hypothetical protein